MRIGIVTTWFERGAAYVSRQYRDVLLSQGNDVFIYARGGEKYAIGDPLWDGPTVTWAKHPHLSFPMAIDLDDFENWITRNKLEVLLFNEQQWFPAVVKARDMGMLTIAYVDYYREDTVDLFSVYDILFCNTRRHYSVFNWHPQSYYLPWGTDITCYKPSGKENNMPTFFHSAGMSPFRKGTDLAIRAFERMPAPTRLVLHAQKELNLQVISPLADRLMAEGRLSVHVGDVPAPGLYHTADIYLYPARLDGIGLTVAEALASGLPVIVPDWPPMNEFIDSNNGSLVAVNKIWSRADGYYWPQCEVDIDSLANSMIYYIDNYRQVGNLKKKARSSAEKNYDWHKNAGALSSIIAKSNRIDVKDETIKTIMGKLPISFSTQSEDVFAWFAKKHPSANSLLRKTLKIYRVLQRGEK